MIRRVLTHALLGLLRGLARLPHPVVRRTGEAIGALLWVLARPRRHVTLVNLRLCFPELSEAERRRLGRRHFMCFGRTFTERFMLWYAPEARVRELVKVEGAEHWRAHEGRPLIMLAPHFLGLDAGGVRQLLERPMLSMYTRQRNPVLDAEVLRGRSRFHGSVLVSRGDGILKAVRHMRAGTPFYFLPDMDLGARDAVFVPFFGVPAATVTAVARLAATTGARVVPVITELTDDGYLMRFFPAWEDYPSGDVTADTARMNAFIEAHARRIPEQYLWSHKRFKTRPPGEPSPYR